MKISKSEHETLIKSFRDNIAGTLKTSVQKGVRKSGADTDVDVAPGELSISKYLRGAILGKWSEADSEQKLFKALGTEDGTRGGFFFPPQLSDQLIERLMEQAVIRNMPGVQVISMTTGDTMRFNRVSAGPTITWEGENESIDEDTTLSFDQVTLQLHKATCLYKMSRELLENAGPSVDAIVRDEISKELAVEEDKVILRGTGGKKPQGIYYHPGVLSTDLSGYLSLDHIQDAIYQVRAQKGQISGWVTHPRTTNDLRQLKDASGRYMLNTASLIGSPGVGEVGNLFGATCRETTQIDLDQRPASNETFIVGGQWDQLLIGERPGLRIETTTEGGDSFQYDQVWLKVIKKVGYVLRHPELFDVIKGIQAN